jgi:hypothetical protein
MKLNNKITKLALPICAVAVLAGCTKLNENLKSTFTSEQVATQPGSTDLLVAGAYTDLTALMHNQDRLFSLEENSTDESLVPTRGGDWDDNGVWRVVHSHAWTADHDQILQTFNLLNKLNFDATNVLLFNPTASQVAQAKFLRSLALFYQIDLFGQYPIRQPGEDLRKAPVVRTGQEAIDSIINDLNEALPNLDTTYKDPSIATQNAAKVMLMKLYLNKGAFLNKAAPTFDPADMQQVIDLGTSIINSGKYSLYATDSNYFSNFSVDNDIKSREAIFTYKNTSGVATNHGQIEGYWMMTLHYNSYTPKNPNAGWNGFSTTSDFYNTFNTTGTPATTYSMADSVFDKRIGLRPYKGATEVSGIRPGFLAGQQYDEAGKPKKDRKGNALAYTPQISENMIETGPNLEVTGIRVVKYVPDYTSGGQYYGGPAGNDLMILRYADVWLMVAEAKMRTGDIAGGLKMVNELRQTRGAAPFAALPLVNENNVDDPNTLLAERGRELYWEKSRRTDLIRFGVYLKPWQYKPTDDPKYLFFPIPNQALAANPNLKQNPGY